MRTLSIMFGIAAMALSSCKPNADQIISQPGSFKVFDKILFYDGYAQTVTNPVPPGVIRVSNAVYAAKLTPDQLNLVGTDLRMKVTVKASCDNYDRIGSVRLVLIDKGMPYNSAKMPVRLEICRFITPFMDKNKQPDEVPYVFNVNNLALLLKDTGLIARFDFWMELNIFGVPYAANNEIAGCKDRNDTFFGTLEFTSSQTLNPSAGANLTAILYEFGLNNYQGTDQIGKTIKEMNFDLLQPVKDASLYLITSNHGANAGGEEYNRRQHFIYFDNKQVLTYTPGGKSCEPYRGYNTQGNGIYGPAPKTDAQWASFSNWCPGDAIPIRTIKVGDLAAGRHTFKIEVPDARFVGKQGNIPTSVYLQGKQ